MASCWRPWATNAIKERRGEEKGGEGRGAAGAGAGAGAKTMEEKDDDRESTRRGGPRPVGGLDGRINVCKTGDAIKLDEADEEEKERKSRIRSARVERYTG
eukprot:767404-Hanusia_phi.AAC.2